MCTTKQLTCNSVSGIRCDVIDCNRLAPKHTAANASQCQHTANSFRANLVMFDGRMQCELWQCEQHTVEHIMDEIKGVYTIIKCHIALFYVIMFIIYIYNGILYYIYIVYYIYIMARNNGKK